MAYAYAYELKKRRERTERAYDSFKTKFPGQDMYEAVRSLALLRHDLHIEGHTVLFNTKKGRQLRRNIAAKIKALEVFEKNHAGLLNDRDFSVIFSDIVKTGKAIKENPGSYDDSFERFFSLKEKANEEITKILKAIDTEYSTSFTPVGKYRNSDMNALKEKTKRQIEWMLSQKGLSIQKKDQKNALQEEKTEQPDRINEQKETKVPEPDSRDEMMKQALEASQELSQEPQEPQEPKKKHKPIRR